MAKVEQRDRLKFLRTGQPPHHQTHHRRVCEGFCWHAQPLMILVHAAVVPQRRQGPFRYPAPRQYLEAPAWEQLFSRSMFRPSLLHSLAQASSTFSGGGFGERCTTSTLRPKELSAHSLPRPW